MESKTVAVVGAGPGLGMGVARAFGAHGFQVGLIARGKEGLEARVRELAALGVTAAAFPADIHDRAGLAAALSDLARTLGPVDVLVYGPSPTGIITHAAQTTAESATAQFELQVLGAITAVEQVLPGMRARGEGTLLLTTGVSSMIGLPFLGNVGIAMAGLRNWAYALAAELRPEGVHVGTVTIALGIEPGSGEGDPDAIGARYYRMHENRDRTEEIVGDPEAIRALIQPPADH